LQTNFAPSPRVSAQVRPISGWKVLRRKRRSSRQNSISTGSYISPLVSGETEQAAKGLAEPALVLSLPAVATALDDGLLTSSEVAQLKLNADWVVLSACNTAAADKPGAEALSGLARAFF